VASGKHLDRNATTKAVTIVASNGKPNQKWEFKKLD
jgi:hypothetical protein